MKIVYAHAIRAFRQNFVLMLLLVAVGMFLPLVISNGIGGKVALYTLVLFYLHRTILVGLPFGTATPDPALPAKAYPDYPGWRMWVVVLLLFGAVAAIMLCLYLLTRGWGRDANEQLGVVFILFLPIYWVLLTLFGTAIPAAALNHETGLGPALRRAKRTWGFVAANLLLGPALLSAVIFSLWIWLEDAGYYQGEWGTIWDITAADALIEFCLLLGSAFSTALAAAVFSEAYLRGLRQQSPDLTSP